MCMKMKEKLSNYDSDVTWEYNSEESYSDSSFCASDKTLQKNSFFEERNKMHSKKTNEKQLLQAIKKCQSDIEKKIDNLRTELQCQTIIVLVISFVIYMLINYLII